MLVGFYVTDGRFHKAYPLPTHDLLRPVSLPDLYLRNLCFARRATELECATASRLNTPCIESYALYELERLKWIEDAAEVPDTFIKAETMAIRKFAKQMIGRDIAP